MKKIIFSLAILLGFSSISFAQQNYKTAIGLRGGYGSGLTVKHFIKTNHALEGIVNSYWGGGAVITGLYEVHMGGIDEPGFAWYYGGGAHIGFWGNGVVNRFDNTYNGDATIGLDGIIGIEYTFDEIPLNLSLDWKPSIDLIGYQKFWGNEFALSVRFAIK